MTGSVDGCLFRGCQLDPAFCGGVGKGEEEKFFFEKRGGQAQKANQKQVYGKYF